MPVITGTGHVVGVTYASHYWGGTYEAVEAVGAHEVRVRWSDGRESVHATRLDRDRVGHPDRDHPVSDPCVRRIECAARTREMRKQAQTQG